PRACLLAPPLLHQRQKPGLIRLPVSALLLVLVQHLLSWRQVRQVDVIHSADLLEEVSEIIPLREARKLRDVVQADIDDPLGARLTQQLKEAARRLLRKSDCEQLHGDFPAASPGSFSSTYATRSSCRLSASAINSVLDRTRSS